MTSTRRLIVMRHAAAVPYADSDHERTLTERGVADAVAAGEYLASAGHVPDHALVSSATRTRQTWDAVAQGCAADAVVEVEQALYGAQPEAMLESVRLVSAEARTVILVGHNPGAEYLASLLDDGDGDPDVVHGLLTGFPPAALAVFEVSGPWDELAPGGARVTDVHVARALRG